MIEDFAIKKLTSFGISEKLLNNCETVISQNCNFSNPEFFNTYIIIKEGYKHKTQDGYPDLRYKDNPYLPEHYRLTVKIDYLVFYITTYSRENLNLLIQNFKNEGIKVEKYRYSSNSNQKNIWTILITAIFIFLILKLC